MKGETAVRLVTAHSYTKCFLPWGCCNRAMWENVVLIAWIRIASQEGQPTRQVYERPMSEN